MCAVVGYVAYSETWKKFSFLWKVTLQQLNKECLHTAEYLHQFPLVGRELDDQAICLILAPFIEAVRATLLADGAVPICVVTDCNAYDQLSTNEKKFVRPPEEHSFEVAVVHSLRALTSHLHISDAVSIQMDESTNVPRLYARYEWMKQRNVELKTHLGGICFLDDKRHPPIQAADMLGNILLKTWRNLDCVTSVPQSWRELTFAEGNPRLQLIHFDVNTLKAVARKRMQGTDKTIV